MARRPTPNTAGLPPAEAAAVTAGLCRLAPYGCDGTLATPGGQYCGAHLSRVHRKGDPGDPVVKRRQRRIGPYEPRTSRTCSIAGCEEPHHADGLCGGHYSRKQLTGDPGTAPIKKSRQWQPPAPREAIEVALKLAGGDRRRVAVEKDGTIAITPRQTASRPAGSGHRGRPPAFDEDGVRQARRFLAEHPGLTNQEAAAALGVSRATLLKYFPEQRRNTNRR
jgi:predicted DNA-binding protein (UPF0251 family)